MQLRPYQTEAVDETSRVLVALGKQLKRPARVCIVGFVGMGKTVVAVDIIRRSIAKGKRVLFLAHRKELIDQCYDKLVAFGVPEKEISVVRASDPRAREGAHVVVASVQTVRARAEHIDADLVFIDEAHHYPNATNQAIIARYQGVPVVGLTATPVFRRKGLKGFFDALVIAAKPSMLIEQGFVVSPEIYTVGEELLPDTAQVKTVASGDFDPKQLAEQCEKWDLVGAIAEHYLWHGGGKLAIAFAASIAHAGMIVQSLTGKGVPADMVSGTMNESARADRFARLRRGDIKVLVNVDIATEGWDAPWVKTLIMARPTKSIIVFIQQSGRVMRPHAGQTATILDHAGNVQRFGYPDADRDWKLDTVPRNRVSVKRCPKCWAVCPSIATKCVRCDHVWTREQNDETARELVAIEGRLSRAERARPTSDPRMDRWVELAREAVAREFAEEWARLAFRGEFKEYPTPDRYAFPARPQAGWPDSARRKKHDDLCASATHAGTDKTPDRWARDKYVMLFGEEPEALFARESSRSKGEAPVASPSLPRGEQLEIEL